MIYRCAICETRLYRTLRYFCWKCYKEHESDIREKKEWVRFFKSEEDKRRYQEKKQEKSSTVFIYLGSKWDIDTTGRLVRKEGYHYG